MTNPSNGKAVVIAAYGRRVTLLLDDGRNVSARIRGRKLQAVCGDLVHATPIPDEPDWLIEAIEPRDNELTRPNMRGKIEILASNLSLLAAVSADPPQPDWYIIDRYLCAAELMRIDAIVVFNKADDGNMPDAYRDELQNYQRVGYPVITCSAVNGAGLDDLAEALSASTSIITGQSGVGKSTLINALTGGQQRTADVSTGSGEGRHTTVTAVMLPLPNGGSVIDSPGVRDYAPAIDTPADVEHGFREIRETGLQCRFSDCRHRHEPGCAVKAAVFDNKISERRYESFRRMLGMTEKHEQSRY